MRRGTEQPLAQYRARMTDPASSFSRPATVEDLKLLLGSLTLGKRLLFLPLRVVRHGPQT